MAAIENPIVFGCFWLSMVCVVRYMSQQCYATSGVVIISAARSTPEDCRMPAVMLHDLGQRKPRHASAVPLRFSLCKMLELSPILSKIDGKHSLMCPKESHGKVARGVGRGISGAVRGLGVFR